MISGGIMKKEEIFKRNYIFFKKELPKLLKDENKIGKFALIERECIIGVYDDFEQALDIAIKEKNYKVGTFLVKKIETEKVQYISRMA